MAFRSQIDRAARQSVGAVFGRIAQWFPNNGLVKYLTKLEKEIALSFDQTGRLRALAPGQISYLDVGARYGLPKHIAQYAEFFDCILVEPEQEEAKRLRGLGYQVVDKALGARAGTARLNVTLQTGASSLRRPNQAVTHFLSDKAETDSATKTNFEQRHTIVDVQEVGLTTVEALCQSRGAPFDLVKVDTQGAEYEIVQGFGAFYPLLLNIEVSMVEYYMGQRTFYDIAQVLHARGYMMSSFDVTPSRPAAYQSPELTWPGLPLHGDVSFIPDWSRPQGRDLIAAREIPFAALMAIFGMTDVLCYLLDNFPFREEQRIRAALAIPVSGRFDPHGFVHRIPMRKTVHDSSLTA